jgi:hypothetical protein
MAKTIDAMSGGAPGKNIIRLASGHRHTGQLPNPRSLRRPMGRPRFFSVLRGSYKRRNGCVLRSMTNAGPTNAGWM